MSTPNSFSVFTTEQFDTTNELASSVAFPVVSSDLSDTVAHSTIPAEASNASFLAAHAGVIQETVQQALSSIELPVQIGAPEITQPILMKEGNNYSFQSTGHSAKEMINEGLVIADPSEKLTQEALSETSALGPLTLTAPVNGTLGESYTTQLDLLPTYNTHSTFVEVCAFWLAWKKSGQSPDVLPKGWFRLKTKDGVGGRLVVRFDGDGVGVYSNWLGSANPRIALASSSRGSSDL